MEGCLLLEDDPHFKAISDKHLAIYHKTLKRLETNYKEEIASYVLSKKRPFSSYPANILNPQMKTHIDVVSTFLLENTVENPKGEILSSVFYDIFAQWLKKNYPNVPLIGKAVVTKFFKPENISGTRNKRFYVGFDLTRKRGRISVPFKDQVFPEDDSVYEIEPVKATEEDVIELFKFLNAMSRFGYKSAVDHNFMFRNFKRELEAVSNIHLFDIIAESKDVYIDYNCISIKTKCSFCNEGRHCANQIVIDDHNRHNLGNVCLKLAETIVAFFQHLQLMIEELKTFDLREGYETMHILMKDILIANDKTGSELNANVKEPSDYEEEEEEEEKSSDNSFINDDEIY
jgi:hypothetical protein